jgi:hypothetical protein
VFASDRTAIGAGSAPTVGDRRVFLGDTDWNGEKSAEAWRGYGLNLDGILSTQEGTNHCAPAPPEGAPQMNKVDGEEGIDNSFGKNLLPIFIALAPDQTALTNAAINAGDYTLLFDLRNLDASDTLSGVDCATFEGGPRAVPPVWNGVDQWPVAWESVENGDPSKPRLIAAASYLTNGTFVSAPKLDPLPLRIRGPHEIELSVRTHSHGATGWQPRPQSENHRRRARDRSRGRRAAAHLRIDRSGQVLR